MKSKITTSTKHLLEENTEEHPYDTGVVKDFLTQLTIKGKNMLINRDILGLKHMNQKIPFKE